MKCLLLSLPLLTFVACSGPESQTSTPQVAITKETIVEDTVEVQKELSLDSLWQELVYEKGGCLTGGQRVVNGRFGNQACVLTSTRNATRADWTPFFDHPKEELTDFLLNQLPDTSATYIHTCPFFVATTGEVAVYCLSKIHLKNWYDLDPFMAYQDRKPKNSIDSEQAWLQEILADEATCELLIAAWKKQ